MPLTSVEGPLCTASAREADVDPDHIDAFKRAHMLRVTPDIWDEQKGIEQCFAAWRKWQGKEDPGFWIDMDMIPFGKLQLMNPKPDGVNGDESKGELKKDDGLRRTGADRTPFRKRLYTGGVNSAGTRCILLLR